MHHDIDLQSFADRLRQLGYDQERLRQRLAIAYPDDIGPINHAAACERLRGSQDSLDVLLRAFWLEQEESERALGKVLGTKTVHQLVRQRVLRRAAGGVLARVRIDVAGSALIVADRRFRGCDAGALGLRGNDPVYPPSADSLMLAEVLDIRPGSDTLDLCTGSGVLAVLAAAHSKQVTGVDIATRAVAMARLNAQLNGAQRCVVHQGDLYAALRAQQFDVIIANPPFVASPHATAASYHSGGPTGDRVLRRITKGFTAHLRTGGRAFVISHVALRRGQSLPEVAAGWLREFPGRAQLVVLERGTPIDLAAAQALFALQRGTAAYAREVRVWVDYLGRQRIESIVAFLLIAERDGNPGLDIVDATPRVLPLPLSKSAKQCVAEWLGHTEPAVNHR